MSQPYESMTLSRDPQGRRRALSVSLFNVMLAKPCAELDVSPDFLLFQIAIASHTKLLDFVGLICTPGRAEGAGRQIWLENASE